MLQRTCCIVLLLAGTPAVPALATTYHVPDQYPTIQSGIDAASAGDTVLVDCGTYYEHDIVMKSGISLLSETEEAVCATIDARAEGRVLYCENVNESSLIKGFTLTGGYLEDGGSGGGLHCRGYSSPTIASCAVSGNNVTGASGGGVYCGEHSSPTIESCTIVDNAVLVGPRGRRLL